MRSRRRRRCSSRRASMDCGSSARPTGRASSGCCGCWCAELVSRRRFLQVGVAGVAVLALAKALDRPAPNAHLVAALVPVVLAGALPEAGPARAAAIREVVEAFDR